MEPKNLEKKKIASIAIGFDTKTDFQRMLGNYARMDYYQYGMGVDSGSFALILDYIKQKNYDVIIVSIHTGMDTHALLQVGNHVILHHIQKGNIDEYKMKN